MRKHSLIVEKDGKRSVIYSGAQRTHVTRMLNHLISKGENAWIESEERKKVERKPILSSITGKPIKRRSVKK